MEGVNKTERERPQKQVAQEATPFPHPIYRASSAITYDSCSRLVCTWAVTIRHLVCLIGGHLFVELLFFR